MSIRKHGGPAFPCEMPCSPQVIGMGGPSKIVYSGMTLRDHFAAKAMQGLMSGSTVWRDVDYEPKDGYSIMENNAMCAYQIADAMLKAREA